MKQEYVKKQFVVRSFEDPALEAEVKGLSVKSTRYTIFTHFQFIIIDLS